MSGPPRASTSMPLRRAIWRPRTLRRFAPTPRATLRYSVASRPAAGDNPRISPAPSCSSAPPRPTTCTARRLLSTAAGSRAEFGPRPRVAGLGLLLEYLSDAEEAVDAREPHARP